MSTRLLDINLLIALGDGAHVHHEHAHTWFADVGASSFATCPLTQNGVMRILGHPLYPNGPGTPRDVMNFLEGLCALPGHVFWPDTISMTDPEIFVVGQFGSANQVTDTYLLGLAAANRGRLATFDRRIRTQPVIGGDRALEFIAP